MKCTTGVIAVSMLVNAVAHAAIAPAQRPPAVGRQSQLKTVRLRAARDSIQVVFALDGPARYKSTRSAQPSRITIDIFQTAISPLLTHREFLSQHAALIRVLLVRSTGLTRAVLDLAAAGSHTVYYVPATNQIVVDIKTVAREREGWRDLYDALKELAS